jgi:hypothetical protein
MGQVNLASSSDIILLDWLTYTLSMAAFVHWWQLKPLGGKRFVT